MRRIILGGTAILLLTACGGEAEAEREANGDMPMAVDAAADVVTDDEAPDAGDDRLAMTTLDCGTIEVGDLDLFADDGSYAGMTDTFSDTCYFIEHPNGESLLWDLGVPGALVGADAMVNGPFTVSLDRTLEDQLEGIEAEPTYVAISHSHFDHVAQPAAAADATWLVHADELAHMKTTQAEDQTGGFAALMAMPMETFTGERDVFGDGSVRIIETPGHTPGHTSLLVMLGDEGPVLLTGDLYHREESREGRKVPRFNTDAQATRDSMERFEALAESMSARVIIQHEPNDTADLVGETLQ